jgi:two-component system nitrogen regulation response regulator GlnG
LIERELFGHLKGAFTGAVHDRKGLLELASGGTVLLDEIGDVAPTLQVKLLRAIEHREVTPVGDARPRPTDIRVIAATNRPLDSLMASGEFREDLFFRVSVFQIHIPPLRERREDIPALAEHFFRQARMANGANANLSDAILDELRNRPWTGNVRELRNVIEHAAIVARGQSIRIEHLPAGSTIADPPAVSVDQEIQGQLAAWARRAFRERADFPDTTLYEQFLQLAEPPVLRAMLEECRQNRAAAAQILGIHRATLREKLRRHGIE